ncbi:MAG: DsbA family protein, partial [Thermodesulfobacteriota bacterium]
PDQIIARAKSQENKDALRERTELAVSKGIFGAPTFAIEGEIFWGNDRLEDALLFYKKNYS